MDIASYPKITAIMRGYTYEKAMLAISVLADFDHQIGIEVTTNNPDYLKIIHDGNKKYGDKISIGVGTVLNVGQAEDAINAGAKFMLGPQQFTDDIFYLAKAKNVVTVPAAATTSEVYSMIQKGADIVKIFPAVTLGPSMFKQIQGPLGKLPLMAVGGVNLDNGSEFVRNGASYLGIGSNFFDQKALANSDVKKMAESAKSYLSLFEK